MEEKKKHLQRSIEVLQEFLKESGYDSDIIKSLDQVRADLIIDDDTDEDEIKTSPYIFNRKVDYNAYRDRVPDIVRLVPRIKEEKEMHLESTLNEMDLFFLSIGAIASSGIFIIPGLAAAEVGYFSFVVWCIIGFLAILMSLCIAELASMFPEAGGIYTYTKHAFGKFVGFLVGWSMWVISWITIAMLITVCISQFFNYIIPIAPFQAKMFAVTLLCVLTFFNYLGVKLGATIQKFFTAITLIVLSTFIITGIGEVDTSFIYNMSMEVPPLAFFAAAALIIEPFIGWQEITFLAEETKNPQKAVPRALVSSTIFIVFLYLLVVFVSLGVTPEDDLDGFAHSKMPFANAANRFLPSVVVVFLIIGTIIILLGSTNSWILSSSRLPYALAKDDVIPQFFAKIHNQFKTPVHSLLFQLVIASFLVIFADFELLLKSLIPISLMVYASVFMAVLVLRIKKPSMERPFEMPFFSIISMICILFTMILIFETDALTMLKGAFLVLIGIPFYVFIELEYDQRFVLLFNEFIAPLYDRIAAFVYSKQMRKTCLQQAAIKKTDTVLNVSCHTGLILKDLSFKARSVVATEISYQKIQIARRKCQNRDNMMYVICDAAFLPFKDDVFQKIVSLGAEEECVSSDNLFTEVNRVLSPCGRGTFIIFDLFSPPTQWTVTYIESLLTDIGLSFRVTKNQTILTNYYLFVTRKFKSQMISRAEDGDFESYYGSHRNR